MPQCLHRAADALYGPEARLPRPGASTVPLVASTAPELRLLPWWPPPCPRLGCLLRLLPWWPPPRPRLGCRALAPPPRRWCAAPRRPTLRPAPRVQTWRPRLRSNPSLWSSPELARLRSPRARRQGPLDRASSANLGRGGAARAGASLGPVERISGAVDGHQGANLGPGGRRQQRGSRSSGAAEGTTRTGRGSRSSGRWNMPGREARARWRHQGAPADTARSSGAVEPPEAAAAAPGARQPKLGHGCGGHQGAAGPPAAQRRRQGAARTPGGRGSRSSGTVEGARAGGCQGAAAAPERGSRYGANLGHGGPLGHGRGGGHQRRKPRARC